MKFKLLFYGFLNQNERFIQILFSSALCIFFFYRYYRSEDTILFLLAALLFLLTTASGFISLKKKTNLLKRLNKAKIKLESTKNSLYLYSGYKKYRSLFVLLFQLILSGGLTLLAFYVQWKDNSINTWIFIAFLLFLFYFIIILILTYYEFLPKITLQKNSISYQIIDFKKLSLFDTLYFDDIQEIGLGKFEGYYYYKGTDNDTFEKTYYWLLYAINNDRKRHILMDFDNINKDVIFNSEWEKDMEKVYEILKERMPDITFNTKIRRLSNPNPHKGDKGWTEIGIVN